MAPSSAPPSRMPCAHPGARVGPVPAKGPAMPIYDDVTKLVGNTPLVRLNRITDGAPRHRGRQARVLQPGQLGQGPHRRRDDRRRRGVRASSSPAAPIVEATSGNTGIALAMVGAARGYRVVLTMPESMSKERRGAAARLRRRTGADRPAPKGMKGAVAKAEEIVAEATAPSWSGSSPTRPTRRSTARTTAEEIWKDTDGQVDAVVAGIGTGGTITGVGQVLKARNPDVKVVAVEPAGSRRSSTAAPPGRHPIQGIGANFVPDDPRPHGLRRGHRRRRRRPPRPCARRAAKEEGLLVGISTGAALWAATQVARAPRTPARPSSSSSPASASATSPPSCSPTSPTDMSIIRAARGRASVRISTPPCGVIPPPRTGSTWP